MTRNTWTLSRRTSFTYPIAARRRMQSGRRLGRVWKPLARADYRGNHPPERQLILTFTGQTLFIKPASPAGVGVSSSLPSPHPLPRFSQPQPPPQALPIFPHPVLRFPSRSTDHPPSATARNGKENGSPDKRLIWL